MSIGTIIFLGVILLIIAFGFYAIRKAKSGPAVENNQKIVILNERNFQLETKNSLVLIDFWAEWCMPCKVLAPIINELAEEVEGNIKICKVNIDEQRNLAAKFSIRSIPTMLILKNGKEINRIIGVKPKHFLLKQLSSVK